VRTYLIYTKGGMMYLEALIKLLLLLVYNAKSEINLICLFKVGLHLHDLRERFFCVVKRSIPVIQYAYTIPELGFLQITVSGAILSTSKEYLWISEMVQCLLVCGVSLL